MKKIILMLALAAASSVTYGQVENVKKAKKLSSSSTPDFTQAKSLIDAAIKDESTKNSAYTWYVKGLVDYNMYVFEDDKRFNVPPGKADVNIQSEAAYNALLAWKIADSLDVVESVNNPKRKGKLEFRKDIVKNIAPLKNFINNYGIILFNNEDFAGAAKLYQDLIDLPSLDMFKDTDKMPASDSLFYYAKDNVQLAYRRLFGKQAEAKDTVAFLKTLDYGMKMYPDNSFFLVNRIDYDIHMGNAEGAMANIDKALKLDPNNHMFYFIKGYIYSAKPETQEEAKVNFEKSIELKTDFPQAYVGLGTYYFDAGEASYNKASFEIRNQAQADKEMEKANAFYTQSLPYFEKAHDMVVDGKKFQDETMLLKMQSAYRKLKMYDKEKAIRAERGL